MISTKWVIASLIALVMLGGCAHFKTQKDKERAQLHLQMAADQYNQGNFSQALEATLKALEQDDTYVAAYNHLALIFMETKRYQKAEEAFLKALSLKPDYPEALNNLGVLMNRTKRYREAIAYFEKALSTGYYSTPENALTNMGFSYFKLGDLKKAKIQHHKALDLAPTFCLAHKNLGDVQAKEKNFNKAADSYQQAITHCPFFQESQYKLGLALMKLGRREMARTELEKLVSRHKSGPYVERSGEVLKYLR